jgi:hypothetical protein
MDRLITEVKQQGDAESARALQSLSDNYEYEALSQLLEEVCRQ